MDTLYTFWGTSTHYKTESVNFLGLMNSATNPKGPSTQIVGFQGPKTIQSMGFGTKDPAIWVLGPSG